jgi:ribosomal protein S18 acetylase RimI-like enzyme
MNRIRLIEELAANAVPPAIAQEVDGWRLRYNYGVTRRANAVLARSAGSAMPLAEKIAYVERFYARRNLPARFQVCPASLPHDLDAVLADRGYTVPTPTSVQVAPLAALRAVDPGEATVNEQFDAAWLAAYVAGEGETDPVKIAARRTMLQHVGPPCGFGALWCDGQIAAVAQGVVERGWLGIFTVATLPAFRRRGLASRVLSALGAWAAGHGAQQAYLQVLSSNAPAVNLYDRMGFTTLYQYWYREREV